MSFFLPLQQHEMMREGEVHTVYYIYKLETCFHTLSQVADATAGVVGVQSVLVLLLLDGADCHI
jgi:hypothetical protein